MRGVPETARASLRPAFRGTRVTVVKVCEEVRLVSETLIACRYSWFSPKVTSSTPALGKLQLQLQLQLQLPASAVNGDESRQRGAGGCMN